jgi:hypothetical protein
MAYFTPQTYTPLVTAALLLGLVVYQVARDRFRTWTEVFFIAAFFCGGMYALSDFFFFTAAAEEQARIGALAGFSFMTLTALFFMLFGVVYYTRMRRELFLTIIPAIVLLPFLWANLIERLVPLVPAAGAPPYIGEWDPFWFNIWTIYVLAYTIVGTWAFYRTYREAELQSTKLKRRMQGILIALVLSVILGASTNVLRGIFKWPVLPLFSTTLALPAAVAWYTLSPLGGERFSTAVRRWKARRYKIKMAFLIYTDGTLVGSEMEPGEKLIDRDLFTATLDVIQNFMRTSFPALRGSLQSIRHGDYTLVIERGKWTYLVLVIEGQESDQLRRQMRDLLIEYEHTNRTILGEWRGVPSDAKGTGPMLLSLLAGE